MTSLYACRIKIERCKQRNIRRKMKEEKNKIITIEQACHVAICMRGACVKDHMHMLSHVRRYYIHARRYHMQYICVVQAAAASIIIAPMHRRLI